LVSAIFSKDIEKCRRALDAGADPNKKEPGGRSALEHAIGTKNAEIVNLLKSRVKG
jgi:ankyrin repeat protein